VPVRVCVCVCVTGESVQNLLLKHCFGHHRVLMKRMLCTFHTVFVLCICCLCPWTTNAGLSAVIFTVNILSALNIRLSLSLELKCWNRWIAGQTSVCVCVCVCVSLTGGGWKIEVVIGCWRGSWTVRHPYGRTDDFFTTHTALILMRNLLHFFITLRCPEGLSDTSSVYSIWIFTFELNIGLGCLCFIL